MFLLLIAQTMFGNLLAFRILRRTRTRSLISPVILTKFGTAFASITAAAAIFLSSHARFALFFTITAVISLQVLLKVRETRRISLMAELFPRFLDRWLLNLRTGWSNTQARERALQSSDEHFRALIRPLFDATAASSAAGAHLFLNPTCVSELRAISREAHSAVARLENLRVNLARASDFRRKAGRALRQASIQSAILVLMHFALALFTAFRNGWRSNADLIAASTLLTLAGVLMLRLLARRIRWTI